MMLLHRATCLVPDSDIAGIGVCLLPTTGLDPRSELIPYIQVIIAYSITSMIMWLAATVFMFLRHSAEASQPFVPGRDPSLRDFPKTAALGKFLVDLVDQQPILAMALVVASYTK